MTLSLNFNQVKFDNEQTERLLYKLRQLGWQGNMGLLLLLVAMLMLIALILPKANALENLNAEVSNLKTSQFRPKPVQSKNEPVDVIRNFYALLPEQTEANNKIVEILDTAKDAGLVSNKTQYTSQEMPTSAIVKYQINMPVLGSYIQIRQFMNRVLNAYPTLALNSINLKREDVNNDAVEASIQMTLYLKKSK